MKAVSNWHDGLHYTTQPLHFPEHRLMNIHPERIGFDIDGVVADTMEAFIRIAADHGKTVLPDQITEFEVENCLPLDRTLIESIFARLMQAPLESGLKPMYNAVSVLQDFSVMAPLTFITARPLAEPIASWLESVLSPEAYGKTRLVATGLHDDKARHIKKLGLRYFVDDRAETCAGLAKEGITPILYRQPWNRGKNSFKTVTDWPAIRSLCYGDEGRGLL